MAAWQSGDVVAIRAAAEEVNRAAQAVVWHRMKMRTPWRLFNETSPLFHNAPIDGIADAQLQLDEFVVGFSAKHADTTTEAAVTQSEAAPPATEQSQPTQSQDAQPPFIMTELNAAIAAQAPEGAPDPEDLSPRILRRLPHSTLLVILNIINLSLSSGTLPTSWSQYIAFPHPKRPNANSFKDFRPVTLSSLIARIAERMIHRRLEPLIDIRPRQHGFIAGSSSEFMLARFIHWIEETLRLSTRELAKEKHSAGKDSRSKVSHITLAVAVDFSDAFCTIKPAEYIQMLRQRAVPEPYVRWLEAQLTDRTFRVRWRHHLSKAVKATRGFMQGTVGGPKGWNVIADDGTRYLEQEIPKILSGMPGVELDFGWVADDLTLFARGGDILNVHSRLRLLVGRVAAWAGKHGLTISKKTKAAYFARSEPSQLKNLHVTIAEGMDIEYGSSLQLLGVTIDSTLSFRAHVNTLLEEALPLTERFKSIVPLLAPEPLRVIIIGAFISRWLYAAPLWWSHAADTLQEQLETNLRGLCRSAFGIIGTAPNGAVYAEARILPLRTQVAKRGCQLASRILRSPFVQSGMTAAPPTKPPRTTPAAAAASQTPVAPVTRAQKGAATPTCAAQTCGFVHDFLSKARGQLPRHPDMAHAQPLAPDDLRNAGDVTFITQTTLTRLDPAAQRCAANQTRMQSVAHDILILSDGSVDGERSGAAAAAWHAGEPDHFKDVSASAGKMASSFTAEMVGLQNALTMLRDLDLPATTLPRVVLIGTDGLSALETLAPGPIGQKTSLGQEIWRATLDLTHRFHISFCFFFAHCGWSYGDTIDKLAKQALNRLDHAAVPVLLQDEARHLFQPARTEAENELRATMGFRRLLLPADEGDPERGSIFLPKLPAGLGRAHARLIAQLRTGCCGNLGGWRHEKREDCQACGAKAVLGREGESVKHLFECAAVADLRTHFGITGLQALVHKAQQVAKFAVLAIRRIHPAATE
jgi:ribonuclease HI